MAFASDLLICVSYFSRQRLDCTAFNPRGFVGLYWHRLLFFPPSNVLTLPCDIRCRPPELTDRNGSDTWLAHLAITSLLQVRHLIYLFFDNFGAQLQAPVDYSSYFKHVSFNLSLDMQILYGILKPRQIFTRSR